ncbi:lysozyme inhibitor LprI family protein [Zooshikella sp. RANM57]|uniref:lysozyme inhibitor LprI family protein n=1 Tax=Zooshikella sp. RANM57 TaxID=3425863 RepID=UPI003D6EAEF6
MKNNVCKFTLLFSLVSLSLMTNAGSSSLYTYTPQFDQCMQQSNYAPERELQCIDREYFYQDGQMTEIYKYLFRTQPYNVRKALKRSQSLWLKFRTYHCLVFKARDGHSLPNRDLAAKLAIRRCELKMTVTRSNELAEISPNKTINIR